MHHGKAAEHGGHEGERREEMLDRLSGERKQWHNMNDSTQEIPKEDQQLRQKGGPIKEKEKSRGEKGNEAIGKLQNAHFSGNSCGVAG